MKKYFRLLRVKNHIKNLLIFLPFFFSGEFLTLDGKYLLLIVGCIAFSCVSSVVYIINDIIDCEQDKLHPTKKFRPIASGDITVKKAIVVLCLLLALAALLLIYIGNIGVSIVLIAYLLLNILYSLVLKNVPILDIMVLSSFFLLRVYFGAFIVDVPVSIYLFLTVFSLASMMGANKRKKEKLIADSCRKSLNKYTFEYLSSCSQLFMLLSIVFYSLWIISGTNHLINMVIIQMSIILVIAILLYYQYVVDCKDEGNPVDVFFKNPMLMILAAGYTILMLVGFITNV